MAAAELPLVLTIAVSALPTLEHDVAYAHVWGVTAAGLLDLGRTPSLALLGRELAFPALHLPLQPLLRGSADAQLLLEVLCEQTHLHPERTLGRHAVPLAALAAAGELSLSLLDSGELQAPRLTLRLGPALDLPGEERSRALHSGWLWEADASGGAAWRRRFCVLLPGAALAYYADEAAALPRGVLHLPGASLLALPLDPSLHHAPPAPHAFGLLLHPQQRAGRALVFACELEGERAAWVRALAGALAPFEHLVDQAAAAAAAASTAHAQGLAAAAAAAAAQDLAARAMAVPGQGEASASGSASASSASSGYDGEAHPAHAPLGAAGSGEASITLAVQLAELTYHLRLPQRLARSITVARL